MTTLLLTQKLKDALRDRGISLNHPIGTRLPTKTLLEPSCGLKNMGIHHSISMGSFSYGVSGFYFGCRIGRYCSFGEQVQIGRHSHPMHWASSSPFFYQDYKSILDMDLPSDISLKPSEFNRSSIPTVMKETHIGHDVWIGHGAFILPGVKIGTGALIAAKSVVTKDVPPYALVAGTPAKIIRMRFSDAEIQGLLESKWWNYAPWQMKGITIDKIPDFLESIHNLNFLGAETFSPEVVDLKNLSETLG
jgi:acetyltransferase-like isoleucine patch superfamily enzyme